MMNECNDPIVLGSTTYLCYTSLYFDTMFLKGGHPSNMFFIGMESTTFYERFVIAPWQFSCTATLESSPLEGGFYIFDTLLRKICLLVLRGVLDFAGLGFPWSWWVTFSPHRFGEYYTSLTLTQCF